MSNSLVRTLDSWAWPGGFVVVLVAAVVSAIVMGRVILGPLQKAARRAGQPTQFYMTDFAWLLIQLQASLGLVAAFVERNPAWAFYTVLGFLGCALTAMWWGAIRALSQAGVKGVFRRAVFILVLLPGVEALLVGTMVFFAMGSVVAYQELRTWLIRGRGDILGPVGQGCFWLAAAVAAATLACCLLRLLTLWLLAEPISLPTKELATDETRLERR